MDIILDENTYDARIRPSSLNSSDGPTNIQVNLMIRSIDKIDDVKIGSAEMGDLSGHYN